MREPQLISVITLPLLLLPIFSACSPTEKNDQTSSPAHSTPPRVQQQPKTTDALDQTVQTVKSHLKGGVGVVLRMEKGVPTVLSVIPESPAHAAGLRTNDRILKVNGEPTSGFTLREVVEQIRGYRFMPIKLTIQPRGIELTTTKTIFRGSWDKIVPALSQGPGTAPNQWRSIKRTDQQFQSDVEGIPIPPRPPLEPSVPKLDKGSEPSVFE